MTRYYKATRPDGTDFRTGTIDYAAALGGDPITLPETPDPKCCTADVLHASDVPTETLIGGSWPCRLFVVEGEPVAQRGHKYGFFSLRVIEDVDARLALGPNADAVIAVIERAAKITSEEAEELAAEREAAGGTAWGTAWYAAWYAERLAALEAAGGAAWDAALEAAGGAAWDDVWVTAWEAAGGAAQAVAVRDLISDEDYQALVGPWESVFGPIFKKN